MLSIIIPTLNEENYLPQLLGSIKKQSFIGYEIIITDAGSLDKTVEIAKKENCKIIPGGLPSKGRNKGVKVAQGELLLFIDADVKLPKNFLENALNEFKKRNLDVTSFYLKSENKLHNFLFNFLYNSSTKATQDTLPQAMHIVLIKKNLHQKIGGFDEKIKLGEELNYVRQASKIGKFGVLKSTYILASTRRYSRDGWFKTWSKYFLCQLHMIFLGPVKSDIFRYKFNHYSKNFKNKL